VGLQLLENALATGAGLVALILAFGPVSGGHFNPVVTLADRFFGGVTNRQVAYYLPAQLAGGAVGAVVANLMYDLPAVSISTTDRSAGGLWLSEAVATFGLVVLIFALVGAGRAGMAPFAVGAIAANLMFDLPAVSVSTTARSGGGLWLSEALATFGLVVLIFALVRAGRAALAPFAVGAYITAAYWWSSSTSFANPMIDLARTLSDTFAGIAPSSVPMFLLAQLVGAAAGVAVVAVLYPTVAAVADAVVVPKESP